MEERKSGMDRGASWLLSGLHNTNGHDRQTDGVWLRSGKEDIKHRCLES